MTMSPAGMTAFLTAPISAYIRQTPALRILLQFRNSKQNCTAETAISPAKELLQENMEGLCSELEKTFRIKQQIILTCMQKARAGSQLQTKPSQAKPQTSSLDNKMTEKEVDPKANNDQKLQESEYSNEFLQPINHAHPNKDKSSGFVAGNDGHRVNRSKTQPKQTTPNQGSKRRRPVLLPQIKQKEASTTMRKMEEKMVKLRELYQKKSKLYRKLQFVNKKLIMAKMQLSFPHEAALPLRSSLQPTASPIDNEKAHSKSHTNSRNNNRLFDFGKPKHSSPQSITSVAKNRQVINFIQKMHEESVKRDLNRYEQSQKMVACQLSHVCLECSRSKCQADALGRILKESRIH